MTSGSMKCDAYKCGRSATHVVSFKMLRGPVLPRNYCEIHFDEHQSLIQTLKEKPEIHKVNPDPHKLYSAKEIEEAFKSLCWERGQPWTSEILSALLWKLGLVVKEDTREASSGSET